MHSRMAVVNEGGEREGATGYGSGHYGVGNINLPSCLSTAGSLTANAKVLHVPDTKQQTIDMSSVIARPVAAQG